MRVNAMTESFEDVMVFGVPMLFTSMRVNRNTVPDGLHVYEVRHDDEGWGDPVQIGKGVMVNHLGTLVSSAEIELEPSPFSDNAYHDIEEKDWSFQGTYSTIAEYIAKTRSFENEI